MSYYEHLPIYKKAFDICLFIERMVKKFSRYNKYTLGSDMRKIAREILIGVVKANSAKEKYQLLLTVREKIEELKILIRLSKETNSLPDFKSFEFLLTEVVSIGKQNEGWIKKYSDLRTGQNPISNDIRSVPK